MIGTMQMPENFRYKDVLLQGQPQHSTYDDFCLKHPPMPLSKRAKIFAPFDALRGFDFEIDLKKAVYEEKHLLSEGEKEELNRRLTILWNLTRNSCLARQNRVHVTVTFYMPCTDQHHEACGVKGKYVTASGVVRQVNPQFLRLDEKKIPLKDILSLESDCEIDGREIFAEPWEGGCDL